MSNTYIGEDDLVQNTASRIAVCLCIDTSSSMLKIIGGETVATGKREFRDGQWWNIVEGGITLLDELNKGLAAFYEAIHDNMEALASCEVAIVTFDDSARCIQDFATLEGKTAPVISETGDGTSMKQGIELALKKLDDRKAQYKANGVDYYQPWLVLFTDGEATEDISAVQRETKMRADNRKLSVFTFALADDVNMQSLSGFSSRRPISLKTDKLNEFFEWLGKSVGVVSASKVGETVKLDTSSMDDWANL